jgi:hypothetical protein
LLFSRRKKLKPAQKPLQLKAIDDELRNGLWSVFAEAVIMQFRGPEIALRRTTYIRGSNLERLFIAYWLSYFKIPTDTMPLSIEPTVTTLRDHFFSCPWNEVYDFIEFTLQHLPSQLTDAFRSSCNIILERENAAYRIVGTQITEITSDVEITEIEQALASPVSGANRHLQSALTLLTDRENPDYRNSAKESISAVEAICRVLTSDSKATLGAALKVLQQEVGIHGALKAAFSSLYGYTSDEGGIRHAMLKEQTITFTDAKLMLVCCSAFINYVLGKASEVNLHLNNPD